MFFWLGQPEGSGPKLIWIEIEVHRMARVGPCQTQGCHHLKSVVGEIQILIADPRLVLRIMSVIANGNFDKKVIVNGRGINAFASAGPESDNGRTEKGGAGILKPKNNQDLQGTPKCNQNFLRRWEIWQQLAARQRPLICKCTRCWLTNRRTLLERSQMVIAMPRTFALCRKRVAAFDCLAF